MMETVMAERPAEFGASPGAPAVLVTLCSLAYFLDGLVHSIMGPLAPSIAQALSLSRADLGPIFSANLVGQCIGLVVVPLFVRRMGHRNIVVVTMIGFGIAQAVTGLATDRDSLIVIRIVTGFFLGGALPSCMALIAAKIPRNRRGLAIGLLFTGYGLGAVVAGAVAGLFTADTAWRSIMVMIGIACVASAAAAWRWLDGKMPVGEGGIEEGHESPWSIVSPHYLIGTLMLWLIFIFMLTINYCLNSWLPTLLTDVGRDKAFAAVSISIFASGGIVATLIVGPLIDRFGSIRVLTLLLAVATITLFLVGQVIASATPMMLLTLLAIGGFASLGAYAGVNVVLADYFPDHLRAVGVGWTKSIGRIGTVIAPVLIGLGLSWGIAESTVMSLFAVPAGLTLAALLVVGSRINKADVSAT